LPSSCSAWSRGGSHVYDKTGSVFASPYAWSDEAGQSFTISADTDELRYLRNAVAQFRDTMRFSIRKEGDGYRCTCVKDLLD
jgi:hypothetical protein